MKQNYDVNVSVNEKPEKVYTVLLKDEDDNSETIKITEKQMALLRWLYNGDYLPYITYSILENDVIDLTK